MRIEVHFPARNTPGSNIVAVYDVSSVIYAAPICTVIGKLVSCSHGRSYEYVTEAIKSPCRMWGHKINLAQQLLK